MTIQTNTLLKWRTMYYNLACGVKFWILLCSSLPWISNSTNPSNYRRKSRTALAFCSSCFACIGNLSYVLSIFAFEGKCRAQIGSARVARLPAFMEDIYSECIVACWKPRTLFLDLGILFSSFCIGHWTKMRPITRRARQHS